jgi:hypothetical protein
MPLKKYQLAKIILNAKFPPAKRADVSELVVNGVELFREYKTRKYYSHTGKAVKKPSPTHSTKIGRYDQTGARTILISALCRAWMAGFDEKPTLNHKTGYDTPFFTFAHQIMSSEGIGNIHRHLEAHWSIRRRTWKKVIES